MSSAGASSSSRGKRKAANSASHSAKAGLQFPVGQVSKFLKEGKYADRVFVHATVYLTAVLEFLASEVLEHAGNQARANNKSRITPAHIVKAVKNDEQLKQMLKNVIILGGGLSPEIHQDLSPKSTDERESDATTST